MSHGAPIVYLVDDDVSFARATSRLLGVGGYQVETFGTGHDFLDRLPDERRGCVLVDLSLPDINGLELQVALAATENPLPLIFLTGTGDIPSSVTAMKGGAEDFLTKPVNRAELFGAVDRALAKDELAGVQRLRQATLRNRFLQLTPREVQVLGHILAGRLNKEVADRLDASERTVKAHRAAIMEKLGAGSPTELGRISEEIGVVPIDGEKLPQRTISSRL